MRHSKRQLSIIASFALAALCLLFSLANATTRKLVVAAALIQNRLDLANLECVSIRWARIFGQSYVSEVIKLIEGKLAASVMPEAQGNCPFIFYSNALHQTTRAVKHYGQPALVSMSFGVCKTDLDGKVNRNPCVYKNVYLFRDDLLPLELFEVGFKAFVREQDTEWTLMKIRLGARKISPLTAPSITAGAVSPVVRKAPIERGNFPACVRNGGDEASAAGTAAIGAPESFDEK